MRFICVIAALLLVGCSWVDGSIPESVIQIEKPFGLSWDQSEAESTLRTAAQREACERDAKPLRVHFSDEEIETLVVDCVFRSAIFFDLSVERLPEFFRQGELAGILASDVGPAVIEYAYLHQYYPESTSEDNEKRAEHAAKIRRALVSKYGESQASGVFVQTSLTGFIPVSGDDHPCDLWIIEDVAIVLCSRRITLIDGIDASLTFIKLDRVPTADILVGYSDHNANPEQGEIDHSSNSVFDESTYEDRGLETLLDWLYPDQRNPLDWLETGHSNKCEQDELQTLENVWTLSEEAQTEIEAEFGAYSGDELAMRAIDFAQDYDDETDRREHDKKLMFLFKRASSQGSAIATNEIGASLLYCYHGVEQDIPHAIEWLSTAAEAGDAYAKSSLAKLYIFEELTSSDPRAEAMKLLRECAAIDEEACGSKLRAMEHLTGAL
ncbi:MAG: hypothetical protein AAFZ74_19050 [Pseudomonadota bacterium]